MALLAFPARHLAWTESALFGFDHFLPISKAYLLEISICTASWQSSVRLWETFFCAQRLLKLQLHSRQLLCTNLFIVGVGMSAFGQRRTDESMSQSSTATAVCMSSTESAPSALGKFSPISEAYLLGISIYTAGWQSSVRLWETSFCAQRLLKLQLHSRQLLCTNLFIVGVGMSAFGQRRTDESMSQSSTATAVCMSSTESAPSALGKFSPISEAYLLGISICTAGWW